MTEKSTGIDLQGVVIASASAALPTAALADGAAITACSSTTAISATCIAVGGNSPQPAPKSPVGGDQPQVNAVSATFPLDMAAALKDGGKILTVAAVNATETQQTTAPGLAHFKAAPKGRVWRLTGPSLDAMNQVGRPPQVTVTGGDFDAHSGRLSVAPYSGELYHFIKA